MLPLLIILSTASALLIILASHEHQTHDWRPCLKCHHWFDRQGTTTQKPPWLAWFAIHRDGVCPTCDAKEPEDPKTSRARKTSGVAQIEK
jgi:hypothetical protein